MTREKGKIIAVIPLFKALTDSSNSHVYYFWTLQAIGDLQSVEKS